MSRFFSHDTRSKSLLPLDFKPVQGIIRNARFTKPPSFHSRKRRYTAKKAEGIRYEKKVQKLLLGKYDEYVNSPWLSFYDDTGHRVCQPDGILFNIRKGHITLLEVKLKHTARSWFQLRRLYQPVLQEIFPISLWTYSFIEIVKWYDGTVMYPETYQMSKNLYDVDRGKIGIHIISL